MMQYCIARTKQWPSLMQQGLHYAQRGNTTAAFGRLTLKKTGTNNVLLQPSYGWLRLGQTKGVTSSPGTVKGGTSNWFMRRLQNINPIGFTLCVGVAAGVVAGLYQYEKLNYNPITNLVLVEDDFILKEKPPAVHKITRSFVNPNDQSGLKLVLYQYQTCPFCCKLRAFLDYHGFSYEVVEVNAVTRTQTKWTSYRKVPFLLVELPDEETGKKIILHLKDSSMIISVLASLLRNSDANINNSTNSFRQVLAGYPSHLDEDGKPIVDHRWRVMYHEFRAAPGSDAQREKEYEWRRWVDDEFVHTLSPNVYRTPTESLQSFRWFSEVGQWEQSFPVWERLVAVYAGAAAMWLIAKKLKRKYRLTDDPRDSLYIQTKQWLKAVHKRSGAFLGGASPNLADLAVYGSLSAIEGCQAFRDLQENTNVADWYTAMKQAVAERGGEAQLIKLRHVVH